MGAEKLKSILESYVKQHYGGMRQVMICSDNGWLCILHKHWKYLNPQTEAPRVYLGGKMIIDEKTRYKYSIYTTWQD